MLNIYILEPPFTQSNNVVQFIQNHLNSSFDHLNSIAAKVSFCYNPQQCKQNKDENSRDLFFFLTGEL